MKDIFHIEILWCKDSLPRYFTLIHALLTKERMPEPLWGTGGDMNEEALQPTWIRH